MTPLTLVTGATGLVGNNVVRLLLQEGRPVRVLVRKGADPRPLEGLAVDAVHGDVRCADSVHRACRDVGCVVHAAGFVQIGRRSVDLHRAINVEGARNVARAAREAGARMIHVSSCDAVGTGSPAEPADEDTPLPLHFRCVYAATKHEAEEAVLAEHARGLDVVIVNPAFMLGPWDWKPSSGRMLLEVARGYCLLAPRGYSSICDVRDVAAGILSAIARGASGRRYIMAGQTMSYLDAWRMMAEVTGGRAPWFRPGPVALWIGGQLGDIYGRLTGREPDMNSASIAMAWLPKNYSSRRACDELGYSTRPARQSAADAWEWFRQHGYA